MDEYTELFIRDDTEDEITHRIYFLSKEPDKKVTLDDREYLYEGNVMCLSGKGLDIKGCNRKKIVAFNISQKVADECFGRVKDIGYSCENCAGFVDKIETARSEEKVICVDISDSELNSIRSFAERYEKINEGEEGVNPLLVLEGKSIILTIVLKRVNRENEEFVEHTNVKLVEKIKTILHSNIHRKLKVGDVARMLGSTEKSLNEIFKNIEKITINEYFLNEKIRLAKQMIRDGEGSQTIAEKIGINDIAYYYRFFKKRVGRTPKEYKKLTFEVRELI